MNTSTGRVLPDTRWMDDLHQARACGAPAPAWLPCPPGLLIGLMQEEGPHALNGGEVTGDSKARLGIQIWCCRSGWHRYLTLLAACAKPVLKRASAGLLRLCCSHRSFASSCSLADIGAGLGGTRWVRCAGMRAGDRGAGAGGADPGAHAHGGQHHVPDPVQVLRQAGGHDGARPLFLFVPLWSDRCASAR